MNVRAALVGGLAGRHRMIHDITGFMDQVGRLRRIRLWRLFDHAVIDVQKR